MAEKISVTGEQAKTFLKRLRELENQFEKRPEEILSGIQELIGGGDWLGEILTKERQCHKAFFGTGFDLNEFRKTLQKYGQKRIQEWQKLGLEPHFLPEVVMSEDTKFNGWKIKPKKWYYQKVAERKVLRQQDGKLVTEIEIKLEGIIVLIDTRLKPVYRDGKQMWENDNLLGEIIERLRKEGKIAKYDYGPQSSRFGVSTDKADSEWGWNVKPALAGLLGLEVLQVRLERMIEANVIPQLYPHMPRRKDGKTNTWVWYEEFFKGRVYRLGGGNSGYGGLAHVRLSYYDWPNLSFRPLAVL